MSAAVLTKPKAAPAQPLQPHRWTIAEYRKLNKSELFNDVKTMLLDGEIYVMPMPSPQHDTALAKVEDFLRSTFTEGFHVRSQKAFEPAPRQSDAAKCDSPLPGPSADSPVRRSTRPALAGVRIDSGRCTELLPARYCR